MKISRNQNIPKEFSACVEYCGNQKGQYTPMDWNYVQSLFDLKSESWDWTLFWIPQKGHIALLMEEEGQTALFTLFGAVDQDVAQQLINCAEAEALEHGYKNMEGPTLFNTYHDYRFRTSTPNWDYFFKEPRNPVEYPQWFTDNGFEVKHRYESRKVAKADTSLVFLSKEEFTASLEAIDFTFHPITEELWRENHETFRTFIHSIFSNNPAYQPISREEFNLLYDIDFAKSLCPLSSYLVSDSKSGEWAGFTFCLPHRKNPSTLLIKTIGVLSKYRGRGLMNYLAAATMVHFNENYEDAIFCTARSDNKSLHFFEDWPYHKTEYVLLTKALK